MCKSGTTSTVSAQYIDHLDGVRAWLPGLLIVVSFLSPGAWLVVRLPAEPIAQFAHLAAAALWLGAGAWLGVRSALPRRLAIALAALVLLVHLSLLANPFPYQQSLHDIYGSMPMMLWLLYPLMFWLAASLFGFDRLRTSLPPLVLLAAGLTGVMLVWRWNVGFVSTFGSPAFSVPAFAPLPFIALGLARGAGKNVVRWRLAAVWIALTLAYAGGGLSALFMLGTGVILTIALAPGLLGVSDGARRVVRRAGALLLLLVIVGVLVAQVPLVGSWAVSVADAPGAEQSVATRLYLWDAAQQMVAERPWLGYGPGGYRLSAAEYYDPGVFSYTSAVGFDPIAYSAPSPHSLLWEALTRIGLIGLSALVALFALWALRVRELAHADADQGARDLRLGLAVGFCAYLFALMVTPVHFASGLLGAVVAGLAITVPGTSKAAPMAEKAHSATLQRVTLAVLAIVIFAYGGWRMLGLSVGQITGSDIVADAERVRAAAEIIPGDPLTERRLLEAAILTSSSEIELASARATVDAAPGYISGYTPNLVQFALVGMVRAESLGLQDYSWERSLLERAAEQIPELPSLVAEQLHLAILEQDIEALPELIERAETHAATYPLTRGYLEQARELMSR